MATTTRKMLGQAHPLNNTPVALYNPGTGVRAIVESIVICNATAVAGTYQICLDDNGTTYDLTTGLYFDVAIPGNTTVRLGVQLAMNDDTGNLSCQSENANDLTFTAFGTETSI